MGTQSGVGISHHRHPVMAAKEAVTAALQQAGCDRPDFVFLFASVGYNQSVLLKVVRAATQQAPLLGCSGEGIITHNEADESNFSVAVMVIRSDELRFHSGMATDLKADAAQVGDRIGQAVKSHLQDDAMAMFLFADGLTCNFAPLVAQIEHHLGCPLPIFGGLAADNWLMKQTYQYCNDCVISDGAVWALMSGSAQLAWAANHGCLPIGGQRIITKCEDNIIYEIDHRPVLDVLKEYLAADELDNWHKAVASLCLGFKIPESLQADYDDYLIRFIPSKDDATCSVRLQTAVSAGTPVWMSRRDHQQIKMGVEALATSIQAKIGTEIPKLIFQFDCAGRGKVVFSDQQKLGLLHQLQQAIGTTTPWIGFYTYGEIGPIGTYNCFHNYTAVLAVVY